MTGRLTATPPRPSTESLKTLALKMGNVNKYHTELFNFDFEHSTDDLFYIDPADQGSGNKNIKLTWEIGNEARFAKITDRWTMDLTTSTINLTTKIGGIIDGLARANSNYIIYAFLDEDFNFAGIGLGQQALSSFTVIGGGIATRGTTATFTVSTAYRFVVGARVVVRNTFGTNQQDYQFNWGTVNTIISDTSISIDMDLNSEYGVDITSVAGGEIKQWDKYRPYVVTTTTQTLYKPYYTVLGEVFAGGQDKVWQLYKKTDTIRITNEIAFSLIAATASVIIQFARILPLWALGISMRANASVGSNNDSTTISDSTGAITNWWFIRRDTTTTFNSPNSGFMPLDRHARVKINKNNLTSLALIALEYKLPASGMRV